MRNIWSLIAQTSGARALWAISTLVTAAITARLLGPADRGVYVAAIAWVTMFSTFGSLSLGWVAIHVAASKKVHDWLPSVVGSALAILAGVTLAGWTIAAMLYLLSRGSVFTHLAPSVLLVAFAALPLMLWIENGQGILMAAGKLPVMNVAQSSGAIAAIVLVFVATGLLGLRVRGALAAALVANLLAVTISLGHLVRHVGRLSVNGAVAGELLGGGVKLHLTSVGNYLINQANVVIMNHYRSSQETAFFQLGVQLVMGIQIIPIAISAVSYSLVSRMGADEAWPRQKKLLIQALALSTGLAMVAYAVAPVVIPLIFGRSFLPSVTVFRILLVGVPGLTASIMMSSQWVGRGFFLSSALLTVAIGTINVIGNELVVPRWGVIGGAWATAATSMVALLTHLGMAMWVDLHVRRKSAG